MTYVLTTNLRSEDFSIGTEFANEISVLLGAGFVRNATTGKWELDPAAIATTNALAATGTTITSTVNGVDAALDIEPAVDAATPDLVKDLTFDAATGIWTITKNDGSSSTVSSPVEQFLSSSSYDAATSTLTLSMADGTDVDVDLSGLVDAYTLTAGDGVDVTGDGSSATPWVVAAKVDPAAINALTNGPAGLLLDPADIPTTNTLAAGATAGTIKSTVNGVDSNDLDLGAIVRPLADLEMQDAFGVTIGYAYTTNV